MKPVIFLAFANDRVRPRAYLRNLPEELRSIRNALTEAVNAGVCEIVERANATLDDIIDVFQDQRFNGRIAVFHYGGHADSYKLLLEDSYGGPSTAYKEGLASFLGKRDSLQLVFLNSCSTQQHALELNRNGIPLVVATSQDVHDNTALRLAHRFYNGLGNGFTIDASWSDAKADIITRNGKDNIPGMYQDGKMPVDETFPWNFYYKEGAETAGQWNLPDAAHNPLFGLPDAPRIAPLPRTPYFFLGRFRREHAPLFFGRSVYIRSLYNRIHRENAAPVILFYGQSGAGKSSLLEAGLLPRLETSHTCLYLRREPETGLPGTLHNALDKCIHEASNPLPFELNSVSIPEKWHWLESQSRPPLLVILDQVEEVFSRFNPALPHELNRFLEEIKPMLTSSGTYPRGKLLLGYRKEYHPEIEKLLNAYQIPYASQFLEPLDRAGIMQVVTGLTGTEEMREQYHLKVEKNLPEIIADDLTEDRNSPIAPALQIILTKMWKTSKTTPHSPNRVFSVALYRQLHRTHQFMDDFFEEQMHQHAAGPNKKESQGGCSIGSSSMLAPPGPSITLRVKDHQSEAVDSGLVLDLLHFHTTPLGTARSRNMEEINAAYSHSPDIALLVRELKALYLLTDADTNSPIPSSPSSSHPPILPSSQPPSLKTSLAHDTLAPVVIDRYNRSLLPGQRAARILSVKLTGSRPGTEGFRLDENDLKTVEQGQSGMKALTAEGIQLLEESRKHKTIMDRKNRGYQMVRRFLSLIIFLAALIAASQCNLIVK